MPQHAIASNASTMRCSIAGVAYSPNNNNFSSLIADIQAPSPSHPARKADIEIARQFFVAVAVCNTVVANNIASLVGEKVDQAVSFDEEALVNKLNNIGIDVTYQSEKFVIVSIFGKEFRYEVLNILEFESHKKRMSIIVRAPDHSLWLYFKAPKSETFPILTDACYNSATYTQVDTFVSEGWHTLIVGCRAITQEEYLVWQGKFKETNQVLIKREGEAASHVERDLTLLGAVVQSFSLQTMWDLVFPHLPITICREVRTSDIPYPFNELLPFNHHMTHTLEAHYKQPTSLRVYNTKKINDVYARAITLSISDQREGHVGEELKVQFAILCVYLQYIPEKARKEILEERLPMGRILKNNKIETQVQLQSVLQIEESAELAKHIALPSYGRLALIFCDGKPAIHVLEVLNGNCY